MGLGQLPYLGFIDTGQQLQAVVPPAAPTAGAAIGPWGTRRPPAQRWQAHRDTIVEPRQTDQQGVT